MKMRNTKHTVITLVLVGILCGSFALAQTAAPKTDEFRARAEAATKEKLGQLIYYFKPTEDQKTKLKDVLIAQYKDLADHDRVRGPKLKALDDELAVVNKKIAELQKEVAAIEKRKAVHASARNELLLDHKAEIGNVFTDEQRITRLSRHIRGYAIYSQYWTVLPKETQTRIQAQCDAAAAKLIQDNKGDDSGAVQAAYRAIREDSKKVLTPELRQAGDTEYLLSSTMRKFVRIKLTDSQKATIRDMCEQAAKRKIEVYAKYAQVAKDRDAIRRTMSGMTSSSYYYKIREDVVNKVLTDEQLKQGHFKRKSSNSSKKL